MTQEEDSILQSVPVPSDDKGLFRNLEPRSDLYEEGFSHSLQAAATKFKKLHEPKMAKFKGEYSSDASLVISHG